MSSPMYFIYVEPHRHLQRSNGCLQFQSTNEDAYKSTTTHPLRKKVQDRRDKMELWKSLREMKKPWKTKITQSNILPGLKAEIPKTKFLKKGNGSRKMAWSIRQNLKFQRNKRMKLSFRKVSDSLSFMLLAFHGFILSSYCHYVIWCI